MTANLLDFDLEGLAAFCESLGEKRFRATQLFRWIHQRGARDFDQMSDLAKSLREKLKTSARVEGLPVISQQESTDGTIKWLFDVGNGDAVEAVFIPEDDRGTLCVSSQAGCAVGCRFCSTGHQGFSRNLTTGEIVAQLWFAEHFLRRHLKKTDRVISNVVMMGMGEPLQNYTALVPALRVMLDDHAYGLSRRRVTVSTSGIVPKIAELGAAEIRPHLAISLNASHEEQRRERADGPLHPWRAGALASWVAGLLAQDTHEIERTGIRRAPEAVLRALPVRSGPVETRRGRRSRYRR